MNLARQAVAAWPRHPLATRQQTNALRRGYIKARILLGDRWLLAQSVPKKQAGHADVDSIVFQLVVGLVILGAIAGAL